MWRHFFFSRENVSSRVNSGSIHDDMPLVLSAEISEFSKFSESPVTIDTIVLPIGQTLRLLALDLFGSREFWVYIFMENRDKIKNPNRVASGTMLIVPDKSRYFIDADNPRSIARAKSIGEELLKQY